MILKFVKLFTLLLITLVVIVASGFIWKEAKDEIYFLCGNFSTGVEKSSVLRQLNTTNFSQYQVIQESNASRILFNSKLIFVTNQCLIKLDKNDKVIIATYK